MAGNYSYDRLQTVHESHDQDITEAQGVSDDARTPLGPQVAVHPSSVSNYDVFDQYDQSDRSSLKSFETFESKSSGTSISKLKNLGALLRRKPLPRYLRGSIRRHAAADIEPARIGRGVWRDQLLSDRSLRGMAVLMAILAIGMIIVVAAYANTFATRANRNSSSVGGETQSCKRVTHTNTALLLLINVCATMVLGMSNTYQQLVTSLKISDLKHALSTFGDSRVGTNSPFSIKHKKEGKKSAWASWVLLVFTSMPVHFLANSLIGPSFTQEMPEKIEFHSVDTPSNRSDGYSLSLGGIVYDENISGTSSFPCWSAFRTGSPHYPRSTTIMYDSSGPFSFDQEKFNSIWERMVVHFDKDKCEAYNNDTSIDDIDRLERSRGSNSSRPFSYEVGKCRMGYDVECTLHDPGEPKCRLNIRMSAAFTLMTCLVLKAIYRECMVNATDNFRRQYSHTCHKHCINLEDSKTGDELGHCQKCKKWNSVNMFADLSQPAIATKLKKSLISNLGNTALTQMLIMMFCSLALLGGSLTLAVILGMANETMKYDCKHPTPGVWRDPDCNLTETQRFDKLSGGFGGFNRSLPLTSLPPDSIANEFISFSISNGAQFIYSLLYLMLIYNITLISQEHDWGTLEYGRRRLRTTLVSGPSFAQTYLLQLPKKILFPIMVYSVLTHWMLGEALQTQEAIWLENVNGRHVEHSKYIITYAAYPLWIATFLILAMTAVCWWAFTYKREGFIPQMYGSVRVLMASTTQLDDFPENGVQWGDLGEGKKFRHAGLSAEEVMKIVPNELYAGTDEVKSK